MLQIISIKVPKATQANEMKKHVEDIILQRYRFLYFIVFETTAYVHVLYDSDTDNRFHVIDEIKEECPIFLEVVEMKTYYGDTQAIRYLMASEWLNEHMISGFMDSIDENKKPLHPKMDILKFHLAQLRQELAVQNLSRGIALRLIHARGQKAIQGFQELLENSLQF